MIFWSYNIQYTDTVWGVFLFVNNTIQLYVYMYTCNIFFKVEHRPCLILTVKVVRGRNISNGWMDYGNYLFNLSFFLEIISWSGNKASSFTFFVCSFFRKIIHLCCNMTIDMTSDPQIIYQAIYNRWFSLFFSRPYCYEQGSVRSSNNSYL